MELDSNLMQCKFELFLESVVEKRLESLWNEQVEVRQV
jgi:hypothetical protein